jgi:EAL domain-containing protein (putative c-di-GMP-specific phosphodiesterase class I)
VIINRAHELGIQVVGHRVEDAQSAATLWMSGIDFIQGNLVQGAAGALDFDFNAAVL